MGKEPTYVVTDVEFDGPVPGKNSMMSFASAAVCEGSVIGTFEAVLQPLKGAQPDPKTIAWFKTQAEAFEAATADPMPPSAVIGRFVEWIKGLPGQPIFAAHPLSVDGPWMDYYLLQFAGRRLTNHPRLENPLFHSDAFCLRSFAAGRLGWSFADCDVGTYPAEWLGDHAHTHRAMDDALGYAHLLITLMRRNPSNEK